ncbi:MAG: hypothetical protein J6W10_01995 [Kiritimatiellae bacterium]|nr:hypothetical protein [Kiritimatiellia bacterium]
MIRRFCDRCQSEIYEDGLEVIQAKKGIIERMQDAIKNISCALNGSPAKIPERPFPYQICMIGRDPETGNEHFRKEADLCGDCQREFKEWFQKKDAEKLLNILKEDRGNDA